MSTPRLALLPLLVLLLGEGAPAQPGVDGGTTVTARRSVVLPVKGQREVPELRIAPDTLTTLLFGAPLRLAGVEVEARELFSRVSTLEDALLLIPSPVLEAGRKLRLRVRFAEGALPASADFLLVVDPARAEFQVNVDVRRPQEEACWREAETERARAEQCQAELNQVRQQPSGLTGLFVTGLLDEKGIKIRRLKRDLDFTQTSEAPLKVKRVVTYRATSRVAVELIVTNVSARPWMTAGAELVGERGVRLKVLRVWQQEPLAPGAMDQRVVVEADAGLTEARGRFTLWLGQEGQAADVAVEGVVFP